MNYHHIKLLLFVADRIVRLAGASTEARARVE